MITTEPSEELTIEPLMKSGLWGCSAQAPTKQPDILVQA